MRNNSRLSKFKNRKIKKRRNLGAENIKKWRQSNLQFEIVTQTEIVAARQQDRSSSRLRVALLLKRYRNYCDAAVMIISARRAQNFSRLYKIGENAFKNC
jgi:hypothetical protein